ncbi:T9SS type A sorting domain-containing protein [Formosa maritima]|uniref:T9SS type A sorting domain-containing protein n=1 Tax=Formosa maritima TaxID=2592046 RepID=A0A5D0GJJ8_9FLAO|nr:T9SS type A sorting domain-containing protein [Formosa maritima]TYA59113.1 T9SS type A sorting domain-containing protein [Formosa maritima]
MKKTLLSFTTLLSLSVISFAQTDWSSIKTIDSDPGENPYTIASGMINADAYPDLVVGTYFGDKVLLYLNNGDGTFASAVEIATINEPNYIAIADVDGVNGNDIIVTSYTGGKIVWYANNGSGSFSSTENVISSSVAGAGSIYAGLIDGDSFIDIAVSAYSGNKVVWFSNNGTGTFGSEQTINGSITEPGDFDMKDFDGDGDLDAVLSTSEWAAGVVDVYYNDLIPGGTVSFTVDANNVSDTGNTYLYDVDFVDVDNDGALDILVSDSYGDFAWYKKEMAGTYTKTVITSTIPNPGISEVADMDNDGLNDIILSNGATAGDDIVWMKSLGTPPTTLDVQTTIDGSGIQKQVYAMTIADFDNDGDLDIASLSYQVPSDGVYWFENLLETLEVPENVLSNEVNIYPNPTSNYISFKGITSESINVTVYDILGKQIINQTLNVNDTLDVSKLQNGIYILKLENSDVSYRFVKE